MGTSVAVVNVQLVPVTLALPNRVAPLKMPTVSPAAKAALRVPLRVGVLSSVVPLFDTVPVRGPALSLTEAMVAVTTGALVSTVKAAKVVFAGERFPATSVWRTRTRPTV